MYYISLSCFLYMQLFPGTWVSNSEKLSVYRIWVWGEAGTFYLYVPGTKHRPGLCLLNKWMPYKKKINLEKDNASSDTILELRHHWNWPWTREALSRAVTSSKFQASVQCHSALKLSLISLQFKLKKIL